MLNQYFSAFCSFVCVLKNHFHYEGNTVHAFKKNTIPKVFKVNMSFLPTHPHPPGLAIVKGFGIFILLDLSLCLQTNTCALIESF